MAVGRKISGLYVPIQLDTSNVQKDLEGLSNVLATTIDKMQKGFEGSLNSLKLSKGIVLANRSLGELRDSAEALGKIKSADALGETFAKLSPQLTELASKFGGTAKQQREMLVELSKTQAIDQQVNALNKLQRSLGKTKADTLAFVEARKLLISQEAKDIFSPQEIKTTPLDAFTSNLKKQLSEIESIVGANLSEKIKNAFISESTEKAIYDSFVKVAQGSNIAKDGMEAFFASIGKSSLYRKYNPVEAIAEDFSKLPRVITGANEVLQQFNKLVYASGASVKAGDFEKYAQSLRDASAVSALKERAKIEGWTVSRLKEEAKQAQYTKKQMDELGLSIEALANKYKKTDFTGGLLSTQYRALSKTAGIDPTQKGYQTFFDDKKIHNAISAFKELNPNVKITEEHFAQLAKGAGVAVGKVALYAKEFGILEKSVSPIDALTASLQRQLAQVEALTGTKFSDKVKNAFVSEGVEKSIYDSFLRIAKGSNVAKEGMESFFESMGKGSLYRKFNTLEEIKEDFSGLPRVITGANKELQRFNQLVYSSGAKVGAGDFGKYTQALRDASAVKDLKSLGDTLGWSTKQLKDQATQAGFTKKMLDDLGVSTSALASKYKQTDFTSSLGKLSEEYRKLAQASGAAISQKGYKSFLDETNIQKSVAAFQKLNPQLKITSANYAQIAKGAGVAASQVEEYVKRLEKAEVVQKTGRSWRGAFTPTNLTAGLQSGAAAFGVVGGAYGIAELVKSSYQASLQFDNLSLAFQSVYGTSQQAGVQLEYVKKVSDELGLSFVETADGAKKLFAAAKGTSVEKDVNIVFEAFSKASAALKLTGEATNSVFLAVSQVISKGKVSAEELRLQLSERLPGAVTDFAKAIGVSTRELDKMLQDGEVTLEHFVEYAEFLNKKYEEGAKNAARGLQAELARVSNAWFELKKAFVDAESSADSLRLITSSLKNITAVAPQIIEISKALLSFSAAAGSILVVSKLGAYFIAAAKGAKALLAMLMGIKLAAVPLMPLVTLLVGAGAAIYSFTSKASDGEAAVEKYATSLSDFAKSARDAKDGLDSASSAMSENTLKAFERDLTFANKALKDMVSGGLAKSIDIPWFGSDANKSLANSAWTLATTFSENFSKAMASGSKETMDALLSSFSTEANALLEKAASAGASEEFVKEISASFGAVFKVNGEISKLNQTLIEVKNQQAFTGLGADAKEFASGIHALNAAWEKSSLGKLTKKEGTVVGAIKSFSTIAVEAQKASEGVAIYRVVLEDAQKSQKGVESAIYAYNEAQAQAKSMNDSFMSSIEKMAQVAVSNKISFESLSAQVVDFMTKQGATKKEIEAVTRALKEQYAVATQLQQTQINSESVENKITSITKKLEEWNAKVKESKPLSVDVQVKAIEAQIEAALRSGKATDAQVQALAQLKTQLEQTGGAYRDYVAAQEGKKVDAFLGGIGMDYGEMTGDKSAAQREAAERQYAERMQQLNLHLEQKRVSEEEYSLRSTQLEQLKNDAILRSNTDLYSKLQVAVDDYYKNYGDITDNIGDLVTTTMDGLSAAIGNFAVSGARDFASLGDAFANMADRIMGIVAQMMAEQAVAGLIKWIAPMFMPTPTFTPSKQTYLSASNIDKYPRNAKGNAFSSISGFSDSIVTQPTLFTHGSKINAYARGAGLMGEAGAEAVMPLIRTSSGHLGVRAMGASGGINNNIQINVINNTSSKVKTEESQDEQGNMKIDIMIDELVAQKMSTTGSSTYRAMKRMGAAEPLANR